MLYSGVMNISDEHTDDAVNIAPNLHEILLETERMRVLKVSVKPGEKAKMHWHPENMNYILASGKLRFTKSDGTTVDVELLEGSTTNSVESSHAVENIGDTEVQTIQVELK